MPIPVSRNKVVVRLKAELDAALELIAKARESLSNEMQSEWAGKSIGIDSGFLKKLKELTSSFNSLTDAKVRLDRAEKQMEADMTPEEEQEAVLSYLREMDAVTLAHFLQRV